MPAWSINHDSGAVLPALIRRIHEARESNADAVTIWGSGTPLREFLHVDDLASGILHLLELLDPPDIVNIGSGEEISVRGVAELIAGIVGFRGKIVNDLSMPDGTPRKLSDISLIKSTGWSPQISLRDGLTLAYQDFLRKLKQERLRSV